MVCLARTRARDTRVSEFLVAPLFFLVAPLSTCENVPGPGTFLCGPLLKKSGPLFQKSGLLFQKSGPLFFTSGPLFQQNDLFWSFILSPTVYLLFSTHHSPLRCNQKSAHARDACVRARKSLIIVTIKKRSCKILSGLVTDPTPAPSPTREGSCCRLVRRELLRLARRLVPVGTPLPCRGAAAPSPPHGTP